MFTGIITHLGEIKRLDKSGDWRVTIAVPGLIRGLSIGASIACAGVCLTVIAKTHDVFTVQVSKETLDCTTLKSWRIGTRINLERALKAGDELGGHFVSGHVDGLAVLKAKKRTGDSFALTLSAPKALQRFIAAKGSVTLDGVSLTVNEVQGDDFTVNVIPHTLAVTTLGSRKAGETLNLEIDLIARYLARLK